MMVRSCTVLVVDATDVARRRTVSVLERAGFAVREAATGTEALAVANAADPDVVVVDVPLPDVDGAEICRRLHAHRRLIPVLVLSVDAPKRDCALTAHLPRPCDPVALVSAVHRLIHVRESEAPDASDRTPAEELVRRREEQLRNLGDNLPDGVIYQVVRRADGSNYFPYMSSGLERTFGIRATEAIADAAVVYRLILPEDLVRIRAAADESIRTGHPIDVEYRMRTPSGEVRWLNLRARPSPLPDGATQWDAVALDVTDRKHAEERLREREAHLGRLAESLRQSEERYRLLFERSFVGMFRTRSDGIVLECNAAFARILGYPSPADLCGRSVIEHYATTADRDAVVAKLLAGEAVIEAELTGRRRDGTLVPVAMSVRRIVDREGAVHEGTLLDLTDRKRAEEATALRSVAELAHAAAHEINNPLAIVSGQLEAIRSGRDVARAIERARAAMMRITDIVNHMTRITRLESSTGWSPSLPAMLDLRRSSAPDDDSSPESDRASN